MRTSFQGRYSLQCSILNKPPQNPDTAFAESSSAALLSALITQPLLPNADYRWEKGNKVPLPGVLAVRERDLG
jgi:hypothetical protein